MRTTRLSLRCISHAFTRLQVRAVICADPMRHLVRMRASAMGLLLLLGAASAQICYTSTSDSATNAASSTPCPGASSCGPTNTAISASPSFGVGFAFDISTVSVRTLGAADDDGLTPSQLSATCVPSASTARATCYTSTSSLFTNQGETLGSTSMTTASACPPSFTCGSTTVQTSVSVNADNNRIRTIGESTTVSPRAVLAEADPDAGQCDVHADRTGPAPPPRCHAAGGWAVVRPRLSGRCAYPTQPVRSDELRPIDRVLRPPDRAHLVRRLRRRRFWRRLHDGAPRARRGMRPRSLRRLCVVSLIAGD